MQQAEPQKTRARWRAAALIVIAVLSAALIASEFARRATSRNVESISDRLALAEADAKAALAAVIPGDIIANAEPSIYMVRQARGDGYVFGTAFVVDRERGALATAAHVVEGFDLDNADRPVTIVNQNTATPLRVIGAKVHAGWRSFSRAVEQHGPMDPESPLHQPSMLAFIDLPLDVGLLLVDPIDPETGENILGPALPIASDEKLRMLTAGDVIAISGYPGDAIGESAVGFSPRLEAGVIGAMISPIDTSLSPDNPDTDVLIVHRIQLIGGNSGGPIFDRDGEVVGLNTSGSYRDAVGQRADAIRDLLEPLREEERVARILTPDWRSRLARYPKAEDILPTALYLMHSTQRGEQPARLADIDLSIERPFSSASFRPAFASPVESFVLPAPDLDTEERDADAEDSPPTTRGARVRARKASGFVIPGGPGQHLIGGLVLRPSDNHVIYAVDFAASIDRLTGEFPGSCPLSGFFRRHGEEELRMVGPRRVFVMRIPPADDDASPVADLVIKRQGCRDEDNRFLLGVVSWEGTPPPAAAPDEAEAAVALVAAAANGAGSKIANVFNCRAPAFSDPGKCVRLIAATDIDDGR